MGVTRGAQYRARVVFVYRARSAVQYCNVGDCSQPARCVRHDVSLANAIQTCSHTISCTGKNALLRALYPVHARRSPHETDSGHADLAASRRNSSLSGSVHRPQRGAVADIELLLLTSRLSRSRKGAILQEPSSTS